MLFKGCHGGGEWGGVGVRSACSQVEEEGGLAMAHARAGVPRHERRAVRRRQPGDGGAGSRMGEAGEEREGRERGRLATRPARGVGPTCQRRKEGREWQVGLAAIQIKFEIIQIRSNLVQIKTSLPELENFKIKYCCEVFDKKNNFPYSNLLRFRMDFELKIWKVKV
jgi:hypothetical protein